MVTPVFVCPGPWASCISLTPGWEKRRAGNWVPKVSPVGALCLPDWPPIKTLDTRAQVSLPGWQHSSVLSYIVAGKIKQDLCNSMGGQVELCTRFLLDSALCTVFLCWFNLYHFAVINCSHGRTPFLDPVSSFSKSWNLRVILGTPGTTYNKIKFLFNKDFF